MQSIIRNRLAPLFAFIMFSLASAADDQTPSPALATFNGKDQVTYPDHYSLNLGPTGTIEFWVAAQWTDPLDYAPTVLAHTGATGPQYAVRITGDRKAIGLHAENKWRLIGFDFSDGLLHHVALVTYDTLTEIYIDGVLRGTVEQGYGDKPGMTLNIGSLDGVNAPFYGTIGYIRIWDAILPPQIIQNYRGAEVLAGAEIHHPFAPFLVGLSDFRNGYKWFRLTALTQADVQKGLGRGTLGMGVPSK